jgi:phosphatidate phosphatase APP1
VTNYKVARAQEGDTTRHNLLNMYRRFNVHGIPDVRVLARFGDVAQEIATNKAGFFDVQVEPALSNSPERIWLEIELALPEYPDGAPISGQVFVPPDHAQFGVISDLDDTLIKSEVTSLWRLARNTLLHNARTRLPFPGVAPFYQALQAGAAEGFNPIFYISNNPWNLYDLYVDFLALHHNPKGPLFLTHRAIIERQFFRPNPVRHKLGCIETLFKTYPRLPFVLIGDSGEKDPEIYLEAVLKHPGRVLAIYIRDVAGAVRHQALQRVAEQVRAAGSEMLLVSDTRSAAKHATERGLISPESIPAT